MGLGHRVGGPWSKSTLGISSVDISLDLMLVCVTHYLLESSNEKIIVNCFSERNNSTIIVGFKGTLNSLWTSV